MTSVLELFSARRWKVAGIVADAASQFHHEDIAPVVEVGQKSVLELFWGPTLSFKDHALQVVARLLGRDVERGVVIGATSGDTGSAAIEACQRCWEHSKSSYSFPDRTTYL